MTPDLADQGFDELVAPHRGELLAHCYRMLGSPQDAEDAVQETLVRAWRGLSGFGGRGSLRGWLYRIATNVCLRAIERRPRLVLPARRGDGDDPAAAPRPPLTERVWLEPFPDDLAALPEGPASAEARYEQREAVELAFVAAVQHLPARQRAVLLLRDVLGFEPAEIAGTLDTTPTAVYSALQRARKAAGELLPAHSQQATLRTIGDARLREIVDRYVRAWEDADVGALVAMLTEDAAFSMPPSPSWYAGPEAIGAFITRHPLAEGRRWRLVPVRVNAQLGFGIYGPSGAAWAAHALHVCSFAGDGGVCDITSFREPLDFGRFGLPAHLSFEE